MDSQPQLTLGVKPLFLGCFFFFCDQFFRGLSGLHFWGMKGGHLIPKLANGLSGGFGFSVVWISRIPENERDWDS